MDYPLQNVVYFNGTPYINNYPQSYGGLNPMGGNTAYNNGLVGNGAGGSFTSSDLSKALQVGLISPLQSQTSANSQPAQQPIPTQSIQPQLNRLTGQANNALYGGLLGYNQNMPMMSGGSNPQTFAAPQGNFRDAFAGMQGLLGGNR